MKVKITNRRGIVVANRANSTALPQVNIVFGNFDDEDVPLGRRVVIPDGETEFQGAVVGYVIDAEKDDG